jgi:hypothetical protein
MQKVVGSSPIIRSFEAPVQGAFSPAMGADVLIVCGPAGVGKTTVVNEVAEQLKRAGLDHAVLDTDALDQVHPWPPPGLAPYELSRRNLEAVWRNLEDIGHRRLVLAGVFVDVASEVAWIADVVRPDRITVVRLRADERELELRVRRREIGSLADDQLRRTLVQARAIDDHSPAITIDTTAQTVEAVARDVLRAAGWLEPAA